MPQLVLMPAPVTITIFLAFARQSAISLSARESPGFTLVIAITGLYKVQNRVLLLLQNIEFKLN